MKTKTFTSNHSSDILYSLNKERESSENFTDVTLTVGSRDFRVHKCILSTFSPFFKKLFTVEMKEKYENKATLSNIDEETMDIILNFIYSCAITITSENVYKLFEAVTFMGIARLQGYCSQFLLSEVNKENCLKMLAYAKMYDVKNLIEKATSVLTKEFEFVINGGEFKAVKFAEVSEIMSVKKKKVTSEENLFTALIGWVKHDVTERQQHIVQLFDFIKLEKLSGEFLSDVLCKEEIIMNSSECTKRIAQCTALRLKNAEKSQVRPTFYSAATMEKEKLKPSQTQLTLLHLFSRQDNTTVGMEDGRIKDDQITANWYKEDHPPHHARLNFPNGKFSFRKFTYKFEDPWLQVDLLQPTRVTGVVTQGQRNGYVSSYKIAYGNTSNQLQVLQQPEGIDLVIQVGYQNSGDILAKRVFPTVIKARYIRLIPHQWEGEKPFLRLEYLTA